MSDDLKALLEQPPPRPRSAVAPYVRAATKGYRLIGWMIWGGVLLVALMVGLSSAEGERLSTTIYVFLGAGLVLIVPTQAFVIINTRHIRDCLTHGVHIPARIVGVQQRGNTGRRVEEVEVELHDSSGASRRAFATGVTTGASPGVELLALVAPERPAIVALVLPGGTLGVARAAP